MGTNLQESEQRNIESLKDEVVVVYDSIRDENWNKAFQVYNAILEAQRKSAIRKTDIQRMTEWVKMIKEKYDV